MKRVVEPELLDALPPEDARAIHSRSDLRRLNFLMGNVGIIESKLTKLFSTQPPKRIVEIGAGDGTFMLELAKRLSTRWKNLEVWLVDLQNAISPETKQAFEQLGWRVEIVSADVFDWLAKCERADCVIVNLFLHHFESDKLSVLLREAAAKTNAFIACEPHRSIPGIFGTKLLWAIGCNDVTRHDAAVSVRAGFCDQEISELWPQNGTWKIKESQMGLFSHVFVAARL